MKRTNVDAQDPDSDDKWMPPRVFEAEAQNQAAAFADRFQRMFARSLRALRDLRRYSPAIIVQNAEQVNLGENQVNVAVENER